MGYVYEGKGSWLDYKSHFDVCAKINDLTDTEKGLYLAASLRGQAQGVLGNLPLNARTLPVIYCWLDHAFTFCANTTMGYVFVISFSILFGLMLHLSLSDKLIVNSKVWNRDVCAKINDLTDTEKGLYLAASLRGQAQGVLGNLPLNARQDFDKLVSSLEERCSPSNQTELYRSCNPLCLSPKRSSQVQTFFCICQIINFGTNIEMGLVIKP
jgi:hypothetical protein